MSMIAINTGGVRALPPQALNRAIAREVLDRTSSIRRSHAAPQRMLDELISEWLHRRTVTPMTHPD